MSLIYDQANLSAIPQAGSLWTPLDPLIFCDSDNQICAYSFKEQTIRPQNIAADADFQPITVATNRILQTTSTCQSYRITAGGNGNTTAIAYATQNETTQSEIPFAGGVNQTTFMTYTAEDCGVGCGTIQAFESSLTDPWFYECNITAGAVLNGTKPEHEVGEELRALAARGIALQGYAISSLTEDTQVQFQSYPSESIFGTVLGGDAKAMSLRTSRFAAGVIAVTAQSNDNINIPGYPPVRGSQLIVGHWNFIALILSVTAALQFVLSLFAGWVAYQVMIPSNGLLGIARVLRGMTMVEETTSNERPMMNTPTPRCSQRCLDCRWLYRYRYVKELGVYDMYMEKESCCHAPLPAAEETKETEAIEQSKSGRAEK